MATRTIRLMGKAYSTSGDVSMVVNFNSTEVHNGTVTTVNGAYLNNEEPVELATWTIDTSVTGNIPLTITVSGGDVAFTNLSGNYTGYEKNEFDEVITQPVDYFSDLNFNSIESDGKINVSFNPVVGEAQTRTSVTEEISGDWTYKIEDGVTFSCDFVVDSDLVITTVPTP